MVNKHEVFKKDGGQWSFLGLNTHSWGHYGDKTAEYRGHTAAIFAEHYPSKLEAQQQYKGMLEAWKEAVDKEEREKK
jgi:hypothetical protein